MKRLCFLRVALALLAAVSLITPHAPAAPGEEHHDVVLDPADGRLASDTVFTVSFTAAMISASAINAGDVKPPLVTQPKFEAEYLWKSVTEGEWTIKGPLLPGTHYRVTTAPGLKDQQGHVVPAQKWEFDTDAFEITSNDEQQQGGDLSDRPHFLLEANYPVSLLDAADYVYFQDRDSHERLPAEVLIESDDTAVEGTKFTVTPRQSLPMGRTFDVVVNGLCEAHSRAPLAYLHVFAAGETSPIEVKWVGGFNDALSTPRVRIKFSEEVDPESVKADALQLTPPVAGLKAHAESDEVLVEGDFDIKQHYSIIIPKTIKGDRGFGLAAPSKWGVTFHPKDPSIIFPNGEVFQRSASGFKFSLLQVNTGPLEWTLSEVPLPELAAVSARVREYKKGETPLNLKVVGRGKFDGNTNAEEVLREIDWHPPQPLSGAYLFEASATDHDGDKQANRTLVCFSEYILTLKRSHDQAVVRLARMNDGLGAPNLTVRAVTGDNVQLAHAVTDASGLATFSAGAIFPEKAPAELFIADTPTGPAIQYASGPMLAFADYERHEEVSILRGMLVTDRNLYRPGQTVKIHGIVRVEKKGVLSMADLTEIQWKIKNDAGDPVADDTAEVSRHGAWDAEWNIPTGLATGVYRIACESPGLESPDGSDLEFRVEEYRTPLFSVLLDEAREAAPASQVKVSSTYFHGAPNAKAKAHWKAVWANQLYQDDHDFVRSDAYSENALENDEEKTVEGDAVLDANGTAVLRCDPPFADGKKRGRCSVEWTVDVTSAEAQTLTAGLTATAQAAPAWAGIRASAKSGVERTITVESQAVDLDDKPVKGTPIRFDIFYVSTKTVKEKIAPFLV
ncbi:MAG TPA: MG2 domain-containing protein, partial [Chthoniobacteraceae bacterium]